MRSAKVITKAFSAGFQRIVHRFWPVPVAGGQVWAIQGGLLVRKVPVGSDCAALAGVQGFDGVLRADHLPNFGVVVHELAPGVAPQPDCSRISIARSGFERVRRGVDRRDGLADRVAVLTPGVADGAANQREIGRS
jgi:hypothetical protein